MSDHRPCLCDSCLKARDDELRRARDAAFEDTALVVDQCNREGPYNAIGAASRIRALKTEPGAAVPAQHKGEAE